MSQILLDISEDGFNHSIILSNDNKQNYISQNILETLLMCIENPDIFAELSTRYYYKEQSPITHVNYKVPCH